MLVVLLILCTLANSTSVFKNRGVINFSFHKFGLFFHKQRAQVWIQIWEIPKHVCVHDLNRCSVLSACVSQHQATKCALTHTCSIQLFRVTELDSWAAKNTHMHECVRKFQRNPPNGRCFYVHLNRGGAGALFLSAEISHSLSPVSVSFVLSASSFSSHTFSLPLFSAMLPRRLSLPSHALFFLIKSSLYRESLLWRWFKRKGWHKLHITVRPKQIPSAMVKFAALAIFQKAFYSRANICTPTLPYVCCHWTNMFMLANCILFHNI